jgi:hypothetical protein
MASRSSEIRRSDPLSNKAQKVFWMSIKVYQDIKKSNPFSFLSLNLGFDVAPFMKVFKSDSIT